MLRPADLVAGAMGGSGADTSGVGVRTRHQVVSWLVTFRSRKQGLSRIFLTSLPYQSPGHSFDLVERGPLPGRQSSPTFYGPVDKAHLFRLNHILLRN